MSFNSLSLSSNPPPTLFVILNPFNLIPFHLHPILHLTARLTTSKRPYGGPFQIQRQLSNKLSVTWVLKYYRPSPVQRIRRVKRVRRGKRSRGSSRIGIRFRNRGLRVKVRYYGLRIIFRLLLSP